MIEIGRPSYEDEFFMTLNGCNDEDIRNHARLEIVYALSGCVHVETMHRQFDLTSETFCAVSPLELCHIAIEEGSYALVYSVSERILGKNKPRIDCVSTDCRFGDEVNEHIRHHLARIFQYYYKDAENNRLVILSHVYLLIDLLLKYYTVADGGQDIAAGRFGTFEKILNYIHENYSEQVRLDALADKFYLSEGYISRLFQKQLHTTFSAYLRTVRVNHAYSALMTTDASITTIAMDTGFATTTQLIEAFKQRYGVSPGKLRRTGRTERAKPAAFDAQIFERLMRHDSPDELPALSARPMERVYYKVERASGGRRFNAGFFKLINVGYAKEVLYAPIQEQLRFCQKMIGFEFIRFHGIFDEDMMVYRLDKNGNPLYNFVYVDMVYDFILSIGLKPYVEFSFYPLALAGDPNTDFFKGSYLRGLPNSIEKWCALVQETLRHWIGRYGLQAVRSWRFRAGEAYNSFYQSMSFEECMVFFTRTFRAVKEVDPELMFGGLNLDIGQLQGEDGDKIEDYLSYLSREDCLPDFYGFQCFYNVYNAAWNETREAVQYRDSEPTTLSDDEDFLSNTIARIRKSIRAFDSRNRSIVLDTWNSTIWQRDLRNDTCFKSAFIFKNMLENADTISAFGYWVLSDLMEEVYASRQLFHGGYGLLTVSGIPKAAFNAFALLRMLGNRFLQRGDGYFVTCNADGEVQIALYNYCHYDSLARQHIFVEGNDLNRYETFRKNIAREYSIEIDLGAGEYGIQRMSISRTGGGSAYDTWLKMGSPDELSSMEVDYLKKLSVPSIRKYTQKTGGNLLIKEVLEPHEVCVLIVRRRDR